jgi:hypothetical protein
MDECSKKGARVRARRVYVYIYTYRENTASFWWGGIGVCHAEKKYEKEKDKKGENMK